VSVLSYLEERASEAVLSRQEKDSINRSIRNLRMRLDTHFGNQVANHFQFGSTMRGTNLPRTLDDLSDVDLMVVFSDTDKTPQTYLDRLRGFVETHFRRSIVRQEHPTIVLELDHIKFDLVPAINSWWSGLTIPDKDGAWQGTDPDGFNKELAERHAQCDKKLRPAIRLIKCWNANNGYPFESFGLEKWIVERNYWTCESLRDYVFAIIDKLDPHMGNAQWRIDCIRRAQQLAANIRDLEMREPRRAEGELRKLIP
jgi:predicted nucleotidyltransferase